MINQDILNVLTVDKGVNKWVKQDGSDRSLQYKISLIKKKNGGVDMVKENIDIANTEEEIEIIFKNLECLYDSKADGIVIVGKNDEKMIKWWKK